MDELDPSIVKFCGFHPEALSFIYKYIIDPYTDTMTPCGELGIVTSLSLPLLFFTVINLCVVAHGFPRFERAATFWIYIVRLGICVSIIIALIVNEVLSITSPLYSLHSAQLIEYGILIAVWTVYAGLWVAALICKSRATSRWLNVSYFLAAKAIIVIVGQRWMQFGWQDPRCFIILAMFVCLLVYVVSKIAEWRVNRLIVAHVPLEGEEEEELQLPEKADEDASCFSRLLFFWTNKLIMKGTKRQLQHIDNVFKLPPSLRVETIEAQMIESSPSFFSDGEHFSMSRALVRTFGLQFFLLALPRLISDLSTFAGPILLHQLVTTLENPIPTPWSWVYAGCMMLATVISALTSAHFNFMVQKMSLRVRAATVTSIFDKLMKVPLYELGANSTGKIINFVSSDVDRIVNFCNSFHAFWSLPVQLVIALFLLYREVGLAFLAGLVSAVILIPINKKITSAIGVRSEKMMHCKDHRVKLITEVMSGMRAVKLSAWEDFFEKRIGELRKAELVHLKARKYLDAVCVYLWASAPLVITVAILTTFTLVMHETLTAAKVFTSLALVNILITPLNAFPWVLNGIVEAIVSIRRLDSFFCAKDMDYERIYEHSDTTDQFLQVRDAKLSWTKTEDGLQHSVQNLSFTGRKSTIIGISGPVGSGKSTLLLGILGETHVQSEKLGLRQDSLNEGIAYVGQQCWLTRGTVRDNILCGLPFDSVFYNRVVEATCLLKDMKAFPGGDLYEISENGATLSGGQRVRVMLARALYQNNSIYLLDDPFASLDRKVANFIWKEAVESLLKNRGKLVVVVSHDNSLLSRADHVVVLGANGIVQCQGPPAEVLEADRASLSEEQTEATAKEDDVQLTEYVVSQDEEKQEGVVKVSVYGSYGRATGTFLTTAIILSIVFMQVFKNSADWWLTKWTEGQGIKMNHTTVRNLLMGERQTCSLSDKEYDRSVFFLEVYAAIAVANTVFTLARAFLFAEGGVVAARRLHERLLHKLLSAPLSWWDRTPTGRVINRLCADVYTIDDSLPFILNIFLASFFNLLGAMVITLIGLPTITPFILALFVIYYYIQRYYRMTTVELKRLSSLSLSPLYSVLSDSVNGLATIRAHRFVDRFAHIVRQHLTGVIRTHFSSLAASQWLTIRLSAIAATVVTCISFAAIIQHRMHFVDSGMVGLAVTYALSLTSLLNGLLSSFIETEKEMVSVERVEEYLCDVPEEALDGAETVPDEVHGELELVHVRVRYDKHLPCALNDISLKIKAGQKVAILGRTGSGKTTLFQALLRACDLETGRISIDGLDTSKMPLRKLRRIFGIVPQQPFLFSGTLAENLSVDSGKVDRNAMTHLVRVAQLESLLARIGGLDGEIEEGGKNVSAGEAQIVSLCRLLLTKPKVVLVDEATAHMDDLTREKIFKLIDAYLPLCTLLSIIHRPLSLSDYDYVLRMDGGRVLSFAPPTEDDVSPRFSAVEPQNSK